MLAMPLIDASLPLSYLLMYLKFIFHYFIVNVLPVYLQAFEAL